MASITTGFTFAPGEIVTPTKINRSVNSATINLTASDRLLGRSTSGAGEVEEITCTAAGRALLDDANASAQRTTLGLGTMATQAADSVNIDGGAIDGTAIGGSTPAAGAFTTLSASSSLAVTGSIRSSGYNSVSNSGLLLFGDTANNYLYFDGTDMYLRVGGADQLTASSTGLLASGSLSATFVKQSAGNVRTTSDFTKTADTTLADVAGLSVTLAAGTTYSFEAVLFGTQTGSGGYTVALGGTATASSIYGEVSVRYGASGNTVTSDRITSISSGLVLSSTGTMYSAVFRGTVMVDTGGTLTLRFAQATASGASTIKAGSYLHVTQY